MPDSDLRLAWERFKSVPFPSVERAHDERLNTLIDVVLEFETKVAGSIDKLLSGTTVPVTDLAIPDQLGAALHRAEEDTADGPLSVAMVNYTRALVEIVRAARVLATDSGPR